MLNVLRPTKKIAALIIVPLLLSGFCLATFPAIADAASPATQSHPADSKAGANCRSDQDPVQINGGHNDGKWYCAAVGIGGNGAGGGGGGGGGSNPAAPGNVGCKGNEFFGLIPWWQYLPKDDFDNGCNIVHFDVLHGSDVPLVLLAIVDDLLRIAGLVAVIFVIYGAIKYTASQGDPEGVAKAQSTVINALVGMVIAMVAVAFVSFISNRLGG